MNPLFGIVKSHVFREATVTNEIVCPLGFSPVSAAHATDQDEDSRTVSKGVRHEALRAGGPWFVKRKAWDDGTHL